ncbi:MAG: hypothetical protein D8H97_17355 [Neisseria sp.]|nr:MAG: hypothetical protein D8H97_17355 [Neisseria sp.]
MPLTVSVRCGRRRLISRSVSSCSDRQNTSRRLTAFGFRILRQTGINVSSSSFSPFSETSGSFMPDSASSAFSPPSICAVSNSTLSFFALNQIFRCDSMCFSETDICREACALSQFS